MNYLIVPGVTLGAIYLIIRKNVGRTQQLVHDLSESLENQGKTFDEINGEQGGMGMVFDNDPGGLNTDHRWIKQNQERLHPLILRPRP